MACRRDGESGDRDDPAHGVRLKGRVKTCWRHERGHVGLSCWRRLIATSTDWTTSIDSPNMAACVAPSIDLPRILDEEIGSTVFTHRSLGLTRERSPDDPSRQPYNNLKLAHEGDAVIGTQVAPRADADGVNGTGNVVSQLLAKRYPELTLGQTAVCGHPSRACRLTSHGSRVEWSRPLR